MTTSAVTHPVCKIIEAMIRNALSRCARDGIDERDFHAAFLKEEELGFGPTYSAFLARVFKRLASLRN